MSFYLVLPDTLNFSQDTSTVSGHKYLSLVLHCVIQQETIKKVGRIYLLDIVETPWFRFQNGSMMKHFVKGNSKEDYIKLK